MHSNATFLKNEQGQDLIEYTLLFAFVCRTAAALGCQRRRQYYGHLDGREQTAKHRRESRR
jgi:hypothetical protein